MFQLRVENLCMNVRDQVLKRELLHVFRRHGSCSAYVIDGDGSKEAYITYWNLDEARNAKRAENSRHLFNQAMFVHVQREPRVFGGGNRLGRSDFDRDSGDHSRHHHPRHHHPQSDHHQPDFRSRSDNYRGGQADDSIPTRTLFVGNLDGHLHDRDLHEAFSKYGEVEHVDIKIPRNGVSGTFAFVKFAEISAAKEAKQELQHTMLGSSKIRLGYGRGTPSARIHISGLGSWCTLDWLEREFDRFGAIHHIEYSTGSRTALVSFDSVDAASAAAREMNKQDGKEVEHVLVVSFAESRNGPSERPGEWIGGERNADRGSPAGDEDRQRHHRRPKVDSDHEAERGADHHASGSSSRRKRPHSDEGGDGPEVKRVRSVAEVSSLHGIRDDLDLVWTGSLGLRNMSFPMHMHAVGGDRNLAARYLRPGVGVLSITQRLRFEADKLDELRRRMQAGGSAGHCVLLALPANNLPDADDEKLTNNVTPAVQEEDVQSKPLRNLVLFLKQKQAAGVSQLSVSPQANLDETSLGVLHAFPPSDFAREQLLHLMPQLPPAALDDDYLVIVIVCK